MEKINGAVSNINIYTTDSEGKFTNKVEVIEEEKKIDNRNNKKEKNEKDYDIDAISGIRTLLFFSPSIIAYLLIFFNNKSKKANIIKELKGEEAQKAIIKLNSRSNSAYIVTFILTLLWTVFVGSFAIYFTTTSATLDKPIIYIYPKEQTEVSVELGRKENLTCTYPIYKDKWVVMAEKDGTLRDIETGRTYYALYWEGINSKKYSNKLEDGFIVKGEDTVKFLEEKLNILGLNEREAEEFIVYWLPKMHNNKYNYIRFQTMEEIDKNMPLDVTPKPDTLIRVMMEWKGLNKYIDIEEQQLEKVERNGYTVVEWGGTEIK